jgi:hypothetical protein
MAMGKDDWGNGNCNGTGATGAGATVTVIATAMTINQSTQCVCFILRTNVMYCGC